MQSPIDKGYLLLADISGFTQFLADTELEHAPAIVGNIVSFLTKHLTPALEIVEIEGDAVFAHALSSRLTRGELLLELIESTYAAFRDHQRTLMYNITCGCMACQAVPGLNLKFVAHHGDYVLQNLGGKLKPVGTSVNVAHRLLKNDVVAETGWRGYCLFTSSCLDVMKVCPSGMHVRTENYPHLGEIGTSSLNLEESYRRTDENRVIRVDDEDADVSVIVGMGAPPPIIWDWLSDPAKRNIWFEGADWQEVSRPAGRTERQAQNHCTNSKVIEHVLDWRPFEYFTVRYDRSPLSAIITADLKPDGSGTLLHWKLRMNGSLPAPIRRSLARFIVKHVMRMEQTLSRIDHLARLTYEPRSVPTAA